MMKRWLKKWPNNCAVYGENLKYFPVNEKLVLNIHLYMCIIVQKSGLIISKLSLKSNGFFPVYKINIPYWTY